MTCPTVLSTGLVDGNTQVDDKRGIFRGVNVLTGTVAIYDGTSAAGKLLFQGDETALFQFPVRYTEGLFIDAVTGTAEVVVYYGA